MTTAARRILLFAGFVFLTSWFFVQYSGQLFGEAVGVFTLESCACSSTVGFVDVTPETPGYAPGARFCRRCGTSLEE